MQKDSLPTIVPKDPGRSVVPPCPRATVTSAGAALPTSRATKLRMLQVLCAELDVVRVSEVYELGLHPDDLKLAVYYDDDEVVAYDGTGATPLDYYADYDYGTGHGGQHQQTLALLPPGHAAGGAGGQQAGGGFADVLPLADAPAYNGAAQVGEQGSAEQVESSAEQLEGSGSAEQWGSSEDHWAGGAPGAAGGEEEAGLERRVETNVASML